MRLISINIALCISIIITCTTPYCHATQSEQWKYIDSYEGVALYRALEEKGELLPFMATADLDIPLQKVVMALVDTERKHLWAPKLKGATIHKKHALDRYEYSEYYTTPWPFEDREFLLLGQIIFTGNSVRFSAVDAPHKDLAKDDHTLANVKILEFSISPLSTTRCRVSFTFSGDMGGWIPEFVKTIIQKKWPVRFIQAMENYIANADDLHSDRYNALAQMHPSILSPIDSREP